MVNQGNIVVFNNPGFVSSFSNPMAVFYNVKCQMSKVEMKIGNTGIRAQLMKILLLLKEQTNSYLIVLKPTVVFNQNWRTSIVICYQK